MERDDENGEEWSLFVYSGWEVSKKASEQASE